MLGIINLYNLPVYAVRSFCRHYLNPRGFGLLALVLFMVLPLISYADNPHNKLPCTDCHLTTPKKEIPIQESKGKVVSSVGIIHCLKCHEQESNLHPLGVIPQNLPSFLPLDPKKGITCMTCHFVHAKTAKYSLLRGFVLGRFKVLRDLCRQCHGTEFYKKNPHRTSKQQNRCNFCHTTSTSSKKNLAIKRFCRFCHSQRIHELRKDNKSRDCLSCHDPHGTSDTVYYLKKKFVIKQPSEVNPHKSDKYCDRCHERRPTDKKSVELLYSNNIIVLCTSCHWTNNFMHPVDITIPPFLHSPKHLPLSAEKKITCETCHNACAKQNVEEPRLIRRQPEYKSRKDLCFECHNKKRYANINPHTQQYDIEKCLYCHEHDIRRLLYIKLNKKNTLKTKEFLLCMRCHQKKNPVNFSSHTSHMDMTPVRLIIPMEFPLNSDGKITCSTCHDPHFWKSNNFLRGDLPNSKFCLNCHMD